MKPAREITQGDVVLANGREWPVDKVHSNVVPGHVLVSCTRPIYYHHLFKPEQMVEVKV